MFNNQKAIKAVFRMKASMSKLRNSTAYSLNEGRGNIHTESASLLNLPQSLVSVMNFDKLLSHVLRRVARISLK